MPTTRRTFSFTGTTTPPIRQPERRSRSSRSFRAWGCALISDRVLLRARAAVVSLFVAVSACEIEKVGIQPTESMVSLHGVLSASASSQVVLLERTRNGTVRMFAPPFDL